MLNTLSDKLQNTIKKLRSRGKLSEADIDEALKQIRLNLLEADVHYKVVKDFVKKVKERAMGEEVSASLSPGQQVVKIVHEELTAMMGGKAEKIEISSKPPTIIMLAGLQGSGKTTSAAKIAGQFVKDGKRPLLIGADVYRPAAIDQLEKLAGIIEASFFSIKDSKDVPEIVRQGLEQAEHMLNDIVIIDTAGRLHIDDELMTELEVINSIAHPHEVLLTIDAMAGQSALETAVEFDRRIGLTGLILTKMDADSRGGAVLSAKAVTGKPIKFVGTGEKTNQFEKFNPESIASRILGMGDILGLIEKTQAAFDETQQKNLEKKLRKNELTLDDFLDQMRQIKKMGSMEEIMSMLPGMGQLKQLKDVKIEEKQISHLEAIILSMTNAERDNPNIINGSRRKRIAKGSGTSVQEVNKLLNQFDQMKKMMKSFSGKKFGKQNKLMPFLK